MHTWHSLSLGDGMMADTPIAEIKSAFLPLFSAAGQPPDMAVFKRLESEGRLHCEMIAYFSPGAQKIASLFEAEPCGKPARTGLDLLAGDERSWQVLFPGSES